MLYDYEISEVKPITDFIFWVFFNVILPLLPLILSFIGAGLMKTPPSWVRLLKEGELLIFSTTVSATALGRLFIDRTNLDVIDKLFGVFLILIIIIATYIYAIKNYGRLVNKDSFDDRKFGQGSLALAFLAGLFSFIVWV